MPNINGNTKRFFFQRKNIVSKKNCLCFRSELEDKYKRFFLDTKTFAEEKSFVFPFVLSIPFLFDNLTNPIDLYVQTYM